MKYCHGCNGIVSGDKCAVCSEEQIARGEAQAKRRKRSLKLLWLNEAWNKCRHECLILSGAIRKLKTRGSYYEAHTALRNALGECERVLMKHVRACEDTTAKDPVEIAEEHARNLEELER